MSRDQYSSRPARSHQQGRYSAFRATTTGGFIRVDRAVARVLGGVDAAALFHELAWRSEDDRYTDRNGWIDVTTEELEESTTLTRKQQYRVRNNLVDLGVVVTKREGVPARLFYQIDWEELEERVSLAGEIRHRERLNQMGQMEQLDGRSGTTRGAAAAQPDGPNGPPYIREKKTKEVEEPAFTVKEKLPIWQRLDPVQDRDLVLRNRYERPEVPSPTEAPSQLVIAWHELQREWDQQWNKDRRLG